MQDAVDEVKGLIEDNTADEHRRTRADRLRARPLPVVRRRPARGRGPLVRRARPPLRAPRADRPGRAAAAGACSRCSSTSRGTPTRAPTWIAAFPWEGPHDDVGEAELEVGALTVDLPPPGGEALPQAPQGRDRGVARHRRTARSPSSASRRPRAAPKVVAPPEPSAASPCCAPPASRASSSSATSPPPAPSSGRLRARHEEELREAALRGPRRRGARSRRSSQAARRIAARAPTRSPDEADAAARGARARAREPGRRS